MIPNTSVTFSDLEHLLPPETPENYVYHERHLQEQLQKGSIKSIRKEKEGMVRLFETVEGRLDDDARDILLYYLVAEINGLDHLEDEVAALETSHYQD